MRKPGTIKKILIICLSLGLLTSLILAHPYFNWENETLSRYHYFIWGDVIKVKVSNDLDIDRVKIVCQMLEGKEAEKGFYGLDYEVNGINKTVFENGKQVNDIPFEFGAYTLQVQYDGKEVIQFGQCKTIRNHSHWYYFNLKTENGIVECDGRIEGPDNWILPPIGGSGQKVTD
jgi:hypothetical protein